MSKEETLRYAMVRERAVRRGFLICFAARVVRAGDESSDVARQLQRLFAQLQLSDRGPSSTNRVSLFAARTLNVTGQSRVTPSLR